jgi:hypothetical protein
MSRHPFPPPFAALLFILLVPVPGEAAAFEPIAVTVHELDGVDRHDWPVTFSVPFAPATMRENDPLRVIDENGTALPTQARAFRKWRDGSVRWMLVDTRVSVKARGKARLRVAAGKSAAPAAALKVEDGAETIHIDTGALRFEVAKKRFGVLEKLQIKNGVVVSAQGLASLLVGDGKSGSASSPTRVNILESTPLRVRLEIEGDYGNGFDYLIRLEAYAGQPFVRLWHTFTNVGGGRYKELSQLTLEVPIGEATAATYAVGADAATVLDGPVGGKDMRVQQTDNLSYQTNGSGHEGRLQGWASSTNPRFTVGLAGRFFWQEYPKAFDLSATGIRFHLWPASDRSTPVGMGAAKTHELVLWAAPPGSLDAGFARGVANPLVATVDAQWIVRSGALPQAIAPPADGFVDRIVNASLRYLKRNRNERWDDRGKIDCREAQGERPRVGAYGMWNWGDWNFPGYHDDTKGCDAWGNLEYDTTQTLALTFAASERAELQEAMVSAARHFMDVDTIHYHGPRPSWTGMNHPKNPLHFTFELGGVDLGHTWNEGLLSYYYLTGDERGLQTAVGIADYLVERIDTLVLRANPRQWGWPQVALIAAYDATGDGKYLAAALQYARRGMAAHPATEATKWKLGVLAEGLAYTHAATADPEIKAWLEAYAGAVARRKVPLDARFYPAVAYVAVLNGDAQLRQLALDKARKLKLGSWGKPLSVNGRIGFRIHSLLAEKRRNPAAKHGSDGPNEAPEEKEDAVRLRFTSTRLR